MFEINIEKVKIKRWSDYCLEIECCDLKFVFELKVDGSEELEFKDLHIKFSTREGDEEPEFNSLEECITYARERTCQIAQAEFQKLLKRYGVIQKEEENNDPEQ